MEEKRYFSRAGKKLSFALDHFKINIDGRIAADLGSSTGGFTGVLLERGALKVYALDTAYGQLDWSLRQSPRVVVMERTNALDAELPERASIITIDTGWTIQERILPAAMKMLAPGGEIVSLVKPHYEAARFGIRTRGGWLDESTAERISRLVAEYASSLEGASVAGIVRSPVLGGKGKNIEYLIWIRTKQNSSKESQEGRGSVPA